MGNKPNFVQIPYETFERLLEAFNRLDISEYPEDMQKLLDGILGDLNSKRRSLERRAAFSSFKQAHGTDRDEKRIQYMRLKASTD